MPLNIKIPYEQKSTSPAFEVMLFVLFIISLSIWWYH
jgi:hypothetical protein